MPIAGHPSLSAKAKGIRLSHCICLARVSSSSSGLGRRVPLLLPDRLAVEDRPRVVGLWREVLLAVVAGGRGLERVVDPVQRPDVTDVADQAAGGEELHPVAGEPGEDVVRAALEVVVDVLLERVVLDVVDRDLQHRVFFVKSAASASHCLAKVVPLSLTPKVTVPVGEPPLLDSPLVPPVSSSPPPQAASSPGMVAAALRPRAALIRFRRLNPCPATDGGTIRARYSASDSGRIIASCRPPPRRAPRPGEPMPDSTIAIRGFVKNRCGSTSLRRAHRDQDVTCPPTIGTWLILPDWRRSLTG